MKRFLLAAAALLGIHLANAQSQTEDTNPKHGIGIQIGNAFANGAFKTSSFRDEYPAFARDGLLLSGSYTYALGRHLAIGSSLAYRQNRYDLDALVEQDDELVTDKSSTPWRSVFTMADLYFRVPLQNTVEVYLKGSVGASFNRSASWQLQTTYGTIAMPADKATALAMGLGSGINFNVKPFVVTTEATLLYTKPEFTVLDTKSTPFQHRQVMNSFNLSIGVQYRL